jgi:hypothetical protein
MEEGHGVEVVLLYIIRTVTVNDGHMDMNDLLLRHLIINNEPHFLLVMSRVLNMRLRRKYSAKRMSLVRARR